MKAERLIYSFVSYAYRVDASWGHGSPDEGVNRIAQAAHRYHIPVTWIVNSGSIATLAGRIREWHRLYGDDVILRIPAFDDENAGRIPAYTEQVQAEWDALSAAFPWATVRVAGLGGINNTIVQVLEKLDFQGLWGYCWEQSWWDGITHRGIPWGSWYINGENYKAPHPGKGKLVACEWTARDLNAAYHTASPCIYSTDPNDVLRAGLCTGSDIRYWKDLFRDYLENTENNEYVFFQQQQEAHEMENSSAFSVWPAADILESEKMLDLFFRHITQYPITIKTLPEAVKLYHERNQATTPCYMLTHDSPIRPQINAYTMTLGGIGLGPWPETFFYYDAQCQMAFVRGECKPRLLRSYTGKQAADGFDEEIPPVVVADYSRSGRRIEMEFKVMGKKRIPYGLTYWDDLDGFAVERCEGVSEAKIIQNELVFLRFDLSGEKRIRLVLERAE